MGDDDCSNTFITMIIGSTRCTFLSASVHVLSCAAVALRYLTPVNSGLCRVESVTEMLVGPQPRFFTSVS